MPGMEELFALVGIVFLFAAGWVLAAELLDKWISEEDRFFFAPALGLAVCAGIAYFGAHSRLPWLIPIFACLTVAALLRRFVSKCVSAFASGPARRLFYFSVGAV